MKKKSAPESSNLMENVFIELKSVKNPSKHFDKIEKKTLKNTSSFEQNKIDIENKLGEKTQVFKDLYENEKCGIEKLASQLKTSDDIYNSLENQIGSIIKTKDALKSDIEQLILDCENVENVKKNLVEKLNEAKDFSSNILPKIRKEYEMFSGVSRIKFDDAAPANKVKGFILHPKTKDATPFEYNTQTESQYFITNMLWQQLRKSETFFNNN